MDINSSLLKYNMLRNEQSVKGDKENNKKALEGIETTKKINEILTKVTEGTLTVAEATKELQVLGITPQKTYQNGKEALNIAFQGKQYSALVPKAKAQTKALNANEILDSYIKDRVITIGNKAINGVINSAVKGANNNYTQDTKSYAKLTLQNKYGFTESEISTYFNKKALLWRMNYEVINKHFPNTAITSPEELKEVIECGAKAFNYKGTTNDYINGLYTNSNLSKAQIKAYLDDFALLMKKELREKYSDLYLDNVLKYIKDDMLSSLNTTQNIRQILKNFKDRVNNFLIQDVSPYYEITKGIGKNKKIVNFFDSAISPQKLINNKNDILENGNEQAKFLVNLLYDTAEQLNLTNDERTLFFQRVFDAVAKKVGGYEKGDSNLNFSELSSLDKNKDGSWMDEFCEIVEKEASKINPNVDRNPTKLLGLTLSNISAEDFLFRLDELLLHDDGSVRKFAQMVNKALKEFGPKSIEESEGLIAHIFSILNASVGVNKKGVLHQDTIKKLNENGKFFDKLEEVINSEELHDPNYIYLDGDLDEFKQGSTGDCWLLSALISLNASTKGKKIIKKALNLQPNGDVIVNFAGVGVSYTVTAEEIVEAREASKEPSGPWSDGDNDVLVLEIATEKLRRDIASGKLKIDLSDEYSYFYNYASENDNGAAGKGITAGFAPQMLYFLTGETADIISNKDASYLSEDQIQDVLVKYADKCPSDAVMTISLKGMNVLKAVNGEDVVIDAGGGHAISIVDIDSYNKTVTIVDPYNSTIEHTVSWTELAKFNIQYLSATDISGVQV